MKNFVVLLSLLFTILISCHSDEIGKEEKENQETEKPSELPPLIVEYASSNEVFANPERGFMHTWQVKSEGREMSKSSLISLKKENVSIVLRLYYLEKFKTTSLSQEQLNLISNDFGRLREAGLKCVLRFAYTDSSSGKDASFAVLSGHLDQLKPIFEANKDVIAFVQAGFIGAWGEWYYSSNKLDTPANKKMVLSKLLEVLPKTIKIQVRTPKIKQDFFMNKIAIDETVGYGNSDIARVGFHNDCFMASSNDYGTYVNVTVEKKYISDEALFVPTGGETCPPTNIPTASCSVAQKEMSLLKWTYLNLDYYGPVLQEWRNNNCFTDFERNLGYRLALISSSIKPEMAQNDLLQLNIVLKNVGFAPVYNAKNTFLIFRSLEDGTIYKVKLDFDVRYVTPKKSFQLTEMIPVNDIPVGKYELFLKIEDSAQKLSDRPEYCIRLANANVWETSTGCNNLLQTIIIK